MDNSYKEITLYAEGMHCASCEILIEKTLLKKDGVESVDASLKDAEVRVVLQENTHLNLEALNQEFEPLGYRLNKHRIGRTPAPLLAISPAGKLEINPEKLKRLLKNILLAGLLLTAFYLVEKAQLGRFISAEPGAALGAFFLLGLVAGLSSCAALVGGLLLSLTKHWHEQRIDAKNTFQRAQPHLMFHFGRLAAFFVLGGVLGLIGSAITFNNTVLYALVVLIVSVVMFVLALQMLNVPWARHFSFRMPKSITKAAAKDQTTAGNLGPFFAGALTFFLPCGFTLIAQGVALASGSFIFGALTMLYFAFGTLPILVGISLSGLTFTRKPHLTARFSTVAGILILFFALYNVNGQLNVLGLPSMSDLQLFKTTPSLTETKPSAPVQEGQQTISLVAKDFDYIPTGSTTIQAGVPTKLIVDNQGILGCGASLAARGLVAGYVSLKRGQNIIDLGTPKAGTYKITCSMGMVPPVIVKVQ